MQTDFPISEQLVDLAAIWPTYPSTMTSTATSRYPARTYDIHRCSECDGALYPPDDLTPVIRHLLEQHGYRMNGTRKEPN